MKNLSYDELTTAPLHEIMSGMHSTKKFLSFEEHMDQACQSAEYYMRRALSAVAKARADGEIAKGDTGALVAAYMAVAASDYAVHARMKFEEENFGR